MTPQLQEEGLEAYSPELPLSTFAVLSYNKTLERIRRIHTSASGLESTSLVFAHGLGKHVGGNGRASSNARKSTDLYFFFFVDLFFTRLAPSKTYDLLRDDFDHTFIAAIVIGMCIAAVVSHRLAQRREVATAWQ